MLPLTGDQSDISCWDALRLHSTMLSAPLTASPQAWQGVQSSELVGSTAVYTPWSRAGSGVYASP